jgi:hypothetical protein
MASTNKSLVLMNKSIGQIAAPLVAEFVRKSAGLFKKEVIDTCAVKPMLVAAAAEDRG